MILGGRGPIDSSRRRSSRKKKRRIEYGDDDDEDVDDDEDDIEMDEDDFSFADDTDDHDDDFAGGRKRKREVVPANLAKLVPEGFRMVRHLNEKGVVEYRVKKAGPGQAVVARKSVPKEKEPRLVEFGARRSSSSARDDSADNVIFVGHGPGGSRGSSGANGGRRGGDASDGGSGTGGAREGNGSSGPFVKLTYKPSEEELEVSRKQQESLVAHQKQVQSTSSSGTDRVAVVTTATDGSTSTTTLATAPTATRLSPLSHEVTSTTEGDEEVTFTVRNCVTVAQEGTDRTKIQIYTVILHKI